MYRYHRVLYRRLLRGQSDIELTRLREESFEFPTLAELIEDELGRRRMAEGRVRLDIAISVIPMSARTTVWPLS